MGSGTAVNVVGAIVVVPPEKPGVPSVSSKLISIVPDDIVAVELVDAVVTYVRPVKVIDAPSAISVAGGKRVDAILPPTVTTEVFELNTSVPPVIVPLPKSMSAPQLLVTIISKAPVEPLPAT